MRVLVTGANGFVGTATVRHLLQGGVCEVRRALRSATPAAHDPSATPDTVAVGDIDGATDWCAALAGVDVVVHTAARVHMMRETEADPLVTFRRINTEGSVNLARQAAEAGVRRLVFISSVKVNGEATPPGQPFRPQDPVLCPDDPYGISKFEAEQGLREVAAATGLEVVVIRPVLVYGPGVRANFESMMKWVARGVPLPLGAIRANRRSLVGLDNLVDLIACCATHPAAAGQVFFAADGEDVSTTELLTRVGAELGKPARLLPVPPVLLQAGARLAGCGAVVQRLCGSLQVDISANTRLLGWQPPLSLGAGLSRAAGAFLAAQETRNGNGDAGSRV
ncbi:UDP-glucose 4-epimerase family protein [Laribacter hongkongensis]|uniref:SDR family oxidoreductase n=1 Tax=Laribacter hongkongensis TaxID=168471 RepID=A0ABD4SQZ3_9NEIS|nr:SDR family oxidoreductase [Laribacter hongkongensis]MCG9026038.1 SDR family oxidoreductase [Laribacter hongkongensis]MCG9116296.1 SDR family oxidoreductase [Laribacter hongkongensis]MCG9124947.1 SDR family oxidoreductase [Laribacter hongkongensis]